MASTNTVTASLVIDFTQGASEGVLTAEIDSREGGYNLGDTSFVPGSTPYILLYMSSNVVLDKVACSEGSMVLVTTDEYIALQEYLTYANEKAASPQHPVLSGAGSITDFAGVVGYPTIGELAVTYAAPQIGVAQLTYTTKASVYMLSGASGLRPVVIYIAGHTP